MNTKFASGATLAVVSAAALLALGACQREADRAARADAGSNASETSVASVRTGDGSASADQDARRPAANDADVRKVDDGKPMWASNRTRNGEENAQQQFERNGSDFSAASEADYVKKAHAFVDSPPKGVMTVSRRNGDVLYYDPKANTFAVADRQGAPRAMFKPRDGMSYWLKQKQSASDAGRRRDSSRYAARDDKGADSRSDDQSDG
jgi:pyocin large subunit-like protein